MDSIWMKLQAFPILLVWFARANLDAWMQTETYFVALMTGIFFAIQMYHRMQITRRKDLKQKRGE